MSFATRWLSLLFILLGLCLSAEVRAQVPSEAKEELDADNPDKFKMQQMQSREGRFKARQPQPARSFLDITNATVTLDRTGQYAFQDPFTGANGSFPRATSGNTTFAQGFMFAGKVKDGLDTEVRSGGATYFTGMKPGGLGPNGVPEDRGDAERFHVWRVHRDWEERSVQRQSAAYREGLANPSEVGQSAVQSTRDQYEYDWNNWPADDGAPFQDCDNDGQYNPAPPEAVSSATTCERLRDARDNGEIQNVDIPGRPGADQTLWTVSNDIGSASLGTDNSAVYASPEIGVEVQYTVWAYDRRPGAPLGNIAFHNAKIIYAGKPSAEDVTNAGSPDYLSADAHPNPTPDDAVIDSMFISWWVDPDVGTFSNDFVGVDTSTSLAYAYNAGPEDATYESLGLPPPAVGFDFLKGPTINPATRFPADQGKTLGLTSFSFFAAGTRATDPALFDYTGTLEWFNLMRGVLPQPPYPQSEPFINPITGEPGVYTNNGDPVTGRGWIDGEFVGPSDRRMAPNTGPFSMAVGDTVDVTVAQIKGQGPDFLSSISVVRFFDRTAQSAFDNNFQVAAPPSTPDLTATAGDQQVSLSWGGNDALIRRVEEQYEQPAGEADTYEFQGYRVYQLPSRTASLDEGQLVRTFDVEDDILEIENLVFDAEAGTASRQTVQQLVNEGIQRNVVFTRDQLTQRPLANGKDVHYAVTAFAYAPDAPEAFFNVQESSPARITVRPQEPPPSVADRPEVGETRETSYTGSGSAPATDPNVEVILPDSVRTANYSITTGNSWGVAREGTQLVSGVDFGDSRVVDGLLVTVEDTASTGSGLDPNDDSWSFSAEGPTEASEEQLSQRVDEIGVYPNPYRGFNELEDSRFDKFVRFTNLPSPEKHGPTTIRVFTLSGNPVKVIRHDTDSPNPNFEDWDLKNESDTWVSSGLYLVHVNTPFGDKELRLALVMEEEVLRNY